MRLCLIIGFVYLCGCGSHQTTPEPAPSSSDKITLRPALKPGDKIRFHVEVVVESTVTAGTSKQHGRATMRLDDQVDVISASEVHDTFSNASAEGDGEIGDALKRVAAALPSATVTTRFDANFQVASSTIEGTQDDEARTMIMNLTPLVSFRLLPKDPVAVGDSWTNQWNEALRSEGGSGAGKVATNVRYTLRGVGPCGARRCATILGNGEDTIPPQNGTTGTSTFHGEQQVDMTDLVPISKTIESKTVVHGEQQGQQFDYTNIVSARVERSDK